MDLRSLAADTLAAIAVVLAFGALLRAQSGPSPEQVVRRAIEQVWNEGKFDGAPILAPQTMLHYPVVRRR